MKKRSKAVVLLHEKLRFKAFRDKYHFVPSNESGLVKFNYKDSFITLRNVIKNQLPKGLLKYQGKVHLTLIFSVEGGFKGVNLQAILQILESTVFMSLSQIASFDVQYKEPDDLCFSEMEIKITKV